MAITENVQLLNQAYLDQLAGSPDMHKNAAEATEHLVRTRVRQGSTSRRIITHKPVTNDELVPQIEDDNPACVFEVEPDSPAAIMVGFGAVPDSWYLWGRRALMRFSRTYGAKIVKDEGQLRTWRTDIRTFVSDNTVKDMLTIEDESFFDAVDSWLGSADTVIPWSGKAQWRTIVGGLDRDTLIESRIIMQDGKSHIAPVKAVTNDLTFAEFEKWPYNEIGGNLSQQLLTDGVGETRFANLDWIVTIHHHIVPRDTIYYFGDENFIGKAREYEPTSMVIKREGPMISWWPYQSIGMLLVHPGGLARADFA